MRGDLPPSDREFLRQMDRHIFDIRKQQARRRAAWAAEGRERP